MAAFYDQKLLPAMGQSRFVHHVIPPFMAQRALFMNSVIPSPTRYDVVGRDF